MQRIQIIFMLLVLILITSGCATIKYFNAAKSANLPELSETVEKNNIDVNTTQYNGTTALLYAAQNCDIKSAQYLVDKGADMKLSDSDGYSPFLKAVRVNCPDVVILLLNKGADVNSRLNDKRGALQFAVEAQSLTLTALLINKGADVNSKSNKLFTPLMAAANLKTTEILDLLIKNGANLNDQSAEGFTPLMYAVFQENKNIVQALLDAGADVNIRCAYGRAIDIATLSFQYDIQQLLSAAEKKQKKSAVQN